jgi:hypothetical protein
LTLKKTALSPSRVANKPGPLLGPYKKRSVSSFSLSLIKRVLVKPFSSIFPAATPTGTSKLLP